MSGCFLLSCSFVTSSMSSNPMSNIALDSSCNNNISVLCRYQPLPQRCAEGIFGVLFKLLPQFMVLACPYVLSTHPTSLTQVALPDSRYELQSTHACNHLAYSSVSSCNGSASSPQYTTCISPMMASLDLPLLRLVIVAQSLTG